MPISQEKRKTSAGATVASRSLLCADVFVFGGVTFIPRLLYKLL